MSAEHRYEAALSAALNVIHVLESGCHLSRPEKLAHATYTILDEIYRAEAVTRAEESTLPVSWAGVLPALQRHLGGDPDQG
jgi:hypothetical protein